MTYREIRFIGLAVILLVIPIIGIVYLLPSNSYEEVEYKSEKSKRMKAPFGHPDKFVEYFAAAEGLDIGYEPYPQGYQFTELRKAKQANAKRGQMTQLDWIERGPGRTGGRTRAILVDHRDKTFNTFYVGTVGGGVWKAKRSFDNGNEKLTWTPLTDDLPSLAVSAMAGASKNHPDVIYVGTGEGFFNIDASSGIGMFKTTDGGDTWTHLSATINNPDWRYVNRIIVDPDNPDIVIVATNSKLFRSENGGESFSVVFPVLDFDFDFELELLFQDLRAKPDDFNVQFATINNSGIIKSIDRGKTWDFKLSSSSLSSLIYEGGRIELGISQSHPEVVWASVESIGLRQTENAFIDDLYRSSDAGETWNFVDNLKTVPDWHKSFLGGQGWYDNAIAVHPFSPDTVFLGGVHRRKAWIEGDETFNIVSGKVENNTNFLILANFGGNLASGFILSGTSSSEVSDITSEEMTSIEIRFGPNMSQMAHRFSVPPNGGSARDGGAGIAFADYIYRDYVEVPFQVWDTDNNRQLMISFRDQANDGRWDLIHFNNSGPGSTHSREYIMISKHTYDENSPLDNYAVDGGFASGLMYFMWPFLYEDATWDSTMPPSGSIAFELIYQKGKYRNIELWENSVVHVDHHNFTIIPIDSSKNEFHILNGNDGGFAYSRDGGETWIEGDAFSGFNTSQFYDATKRPGYSMYLGGTQDNGTWASYNDANSQRGWRFMLGGDGFDVIWKSADSLMGSIQFNNIHRSLDGGTDWNPAGNILDWQGQFLTSLGWTPESGETVFSVSPDPAGGLLRSLDFGGSWHAIPAPDFNKWAGGIVRVSLADPSVVWAGYRMRAIREGGRAFALHVSENALTPMHHREPARIDPINAPDFAPRSIITGLATHPFSRATAYVTFSVSCQPKLLRTEDMGQTWEDLSGFAETEGCISSNGFPNAKVWDVLVFPDTPRIIWAGTDIGIFESRDHGQTWLYADNGLPAVSIWRMKIVDDEVIVATHGRGVWTLDIGQVQTSVEEAIAEVPASFELLDNYPNPFNPSTTLGFKLSENSHIRITVYDVLGRKVAMLTDQSYTRGSHKITWDASAMSSGQYFYRMEANGELIGAKAMMLVK